MPAVETFKNVPELFEGTFEESIKSRTDTLSTFKQLGPDDLVHVVKNIPNSRQQIKEVSSYHFVTGVDTSSSASIAAYINSLTYSLDSRNKWFGLTNNSWTISKSTFCSFNAFTGSDVRVEARIPGGVKSFVVDVMGIKRGTDLECWQETYLSSILRGLNPILFNSNNDDNKAKRSIDGLFNLQTEMKILETASRCFFKGRKLGNPIGPHLAGNHDNFLTLGVVGYFCGTGRPEIAVGFLKPFMEKDSNLKNLMMKCLLESNNQSLAMKMIKSTKPPFDQLAEFLIERGDLKKAEYFASEALQSAPTNFSNWERLIKIKIGLMEPEEALMILNNGPMSMYPECEFFKNLSKPAAISLPFQSEGIENNYHNQNLNNNEINNDNSSDNQSASQALIILEKLKAPTLKGTYKQAYDLLVSLYKEFGWDGLLQCRSKIFVMEQELYTDDQSNEHHNFNTHEKDSMINNTLRSPLNEPVQLGITLNNNVTTSHFLQKTEKKLCERWLDTLILTLFEDLRIFALFSEELKRVEQEGIIIERGVKEWLLLGKLSVRLNHVEEAKLAFQKCLFTLANDILTNSYHQSALNNLISIYSLEGRVQLALNSSLRLLYSQKKVYDSSLHPSQMSFSLCGLIRKVGIKRLQGDLNGISNQNQNQIRNNSNFNEGFEQESIEELKKFLHFLKEAKVHGYDY